jgi:hypothetical protein
MQFMVLVEKNDWLSLFSSPPGFRRKPKAFSFNIGLCCPDGRTPVMGGIIAAFQGHHSAPWTITQQGFCNNVYKLCIPFGVL